VADQLARRTALDEMYGLLEFLEREVGGRRKLAECHGRMPWPERGMYLFFEPGEHREDGSTPRVVRVGTHALGETSTTTLWNRLRAHRGTVDDSSPGGGNHRGSVFRLHVGTALIERDGWPSVGRTWAHGSSAPRDIRARERDLERAVSEHLGEMTLLWLDVPHHEERGQLERGLIALLSNSVDRRSIPRARPGSAATRPERRSENRVCGT
jgi:hypothetical protein